MTQPMRIEGAKELQRQLRALPVKVRGVALRDAAKAGAVVFRDSARENAPRRTGQLKRDIRAMVTERSPDNIAMGVSWRTGKASRTAAFYGLFFHRGRNPRQRLGKGKKVKTFGSTGSMPRKRFLDKAFDESSAQADRAVADVLRKAVEAGARG